MGMHVLELARLRGASKLVVAGTVCAYPKFTPMPFREDDLWNGYPEETNAPYGLAKKMLLVGRAGLPRAVRLRHAIYLLPANLYGPRDNFDLETSHVVPALIRKLVAGTRARSCCGATARRHASSSTSRTPPRRSCSRPTATTGAEPLNIGTGAEISIGELAGTIAELTGFEGEIVWDSSMPNGQPRRRLDTTRAEVAPSVAGRHRSPRRARAHDRLGILAQAPVHAGG